MLILGGFPDREQKLNQSTSFSQPMRFNRYFVSLLAYMLLVCAPDLFAQRGRTREPPTPPSNPPVATVNGQPIPYANYRDAVDDQIRYQRRAGTATGVDPLVADTILLGLVDDELVRQEAAKRRLDVSREQAIKALIDDPPEFMRAPFIDSRGTFRREVFENVVRDPTQIIRLLDANIERDSLVRQWRADLEKVILYMQSRENRRRLMDALDAENALSESDIRNRFFTEKTRITGSFLRVLHSTIPDSLVPINDVEARSYFKSHIDDYWRAPARLVSIAILPIDPSSSDSALHRARVDSIRSAVAAARPADRARVVKDIQRSLPPDRFTDDPLRPSQLTHNMLAQLAMTGNQNVAGPFPQPGESTLLYIERRAPVKDTVLRARHILIRSEPGNFTADSTARELAIVLRDSIDNEEEFIQGVQYFSSDAGIDKQGDLGFFGRGRMTRAFDSAAFAGPVKKVIGPVRTEHGYHLIWVSERITEGFVLRELRVPLVVNADARAAVQRDADVLASAMRSGVGGDSLIGVMRNRYPMMATDTSYIQRLERYGDVLSPAKFAFGAKVGDVAVLPLPLDRVMVIRLNAIWAGGTPEYEKMFRWPEAHARRARQLDILAPKLKSIASRIEPEMLIGPLRELAPDAEVFLINGGMVNAPPDEKETILDSLVATVPAMSVGGPVRGVHGFYFLRVAEKTGPSESDYQRERATFSETYRRRRRNDMLGKMISDLRARSTFEDRREQGN
ncbi:MAG: peptidylprolyl isomerase [bacterium]|nr:peptidylprolyl isomerase [Candidatus Kapabacteria bacterium]